MRTSSTRSLTDNIVPLAMSSLVTGLFSFLLYMDFTRKRAEGDYPVVGTVVMTRQLAQRRFADASVWESLENRVQVRDGDTLRTDAGSGAVVRFGDGSTLELQENTMIIISREGDRLDVGFTGGSVIANRSASGRGAIHLVSGAGRVSLDSGNVSVRREGDQMAVNVTSGSVTVQGGPRVDAGTMAVVGSTGAARTQAVPLALVEPVPGARIVVSPAGTVFRARSEPGRRITLIVNAEGDSGRPVAAIPMKGETAARYLRPGRYTATLGSPGPSGAMEYSPPVTFEILEDRPLRPVSPSPGHVFTYRDGRPVIPFVWEGGNELSEFTVEVRSIEKPADVLARMTTAEHSASIDTLGEGTYRWTVNGTDMGPVSSRVKSLTFTVKKIRELPPPELLFPRDGRTIPLQAVRADRVMFGWRSDPLVSSFRLVVAAAGDFTRPVLERRVKGGLFTCPRTLGPGRYSWRVESLGSDGTAASSTPASGFTVAADMVLVPVSPVQGGVYVRERGGDVALAWRGGDDMSFRVDLSGEGGRRFTSTSGDNKTVFAGLPEGMYKWRITGMDASGEAVLESDLLTFHVVDRPPAPAIVYPPHGGTVNLRDSDYFVIRWRGDAGNYRYRLTLSRPGQPPFFTTETAEQEYRFNRLQLLDRGTFICTVRAGRRYGPGNGVVEGETAAALFEITLGDMLKKPVIRTPGTVYIR